MFKKSFLSVVFSPSKIQLLLLDSKKQKVVKYLSVPIPAGLIVNHRILKSVELVELLKNALKKFDVSQKSVGIVIPEFSTYSKLLSLPKLEDKELGEAVRWQSQEFLPTNTQEMIMDWKKVADQQDHYQVLVTAIRQDILADFIGVTSKAGLIPLLVETPSLSLTRLTKNEQATMLVIYITPDETILTISQGERILGSSVAFSNSQNEIIATAARMYNHYRNLNIEKVKLGGAGLSQEFVQALQDQVQVPVEFLAAQVKMDNNNLIQEYLIPISLQYKDPAQPEDSSTINLLPPQWVSHYKKQLQNIQIWTLTLVGSVVIWATFLSTIIFYMLLVTRVETLEREAEFVASVGSNKAIAEVNEINKLSQKVVSIYEEIKYPQDYINEISVLKPSGVAIFTYDLNFENGKFGVAGRAADRNSLSQFRDKLEEEDRFSSVGLPNNYLVKDRDNDFIIDFSYTQAQPKQIPKLKI